MISLTNQCSQNKREFFNGSDDLPHFLVWFKLISYFSKRLAQPEIPVTWFSQCLGENFWSPKRGKDVTVFGWPVFLRGCRRGSEKASDMP